MISNIFVSAFEHLATTLFNYSFWLLGEIIDSVNMARFDWYCLKAVFFMNTRFNSVKTWNSILQPELSWCLCWKYVWSKPIVDSIKNQKGTLPKLYVCHQSHQSLIANFKFTPLFIFAYFQIFSAFQSKLSLQSIYIL